MKVDLVISFELMQLVIYYYAYIIDGSQTYPNHYIQPMSTVDDNNCPVPKVLVKDRTL